MQLTLKQAAALLAVPEHRIYEWVDDEEIPFYRIADQLRFDRTALVEWAMERRMPVSMSSFQAAGQNGDIMPDLADALRRGGIHAGVGGTDPESVLRAVVARMPLPDAAERELLLGVLLGREALGAMTIGDGIAIPHVRNPVVLDGAPASLTLCFLDRPIDFAAADGKPVHTVFSIISATIRGHLQLLAKLSWALSDPAFHEALARRADAAAVIAAAARIDASFTGRPRPGSSPG